MPYNKNGLNLIYFKDFMILKKICRQNLPFIILVFALLLGFLCVSLVNQGMGGDSFVYSSIALNMAHGIGSLWAPSYTKTVFPTFYEHPGLSFWLESFFFKILGSGFYVEKIYCAVTAVFTLVFTCKIWRLINDNKINYWQYWLPILVWLLMPINTYAFKHNLPQNTLTAFVTAASYYLLCFYLLSQRKYLYLMISALFMVAAIFTNGSTALYPLGLFFLLWLVFDRPKFIKMLVLTIFLLIFVIVFTGLILLYKPAYHAMSIYFHTQLWASINEHRIGNFSGLKRLNILWLLCKNLLPVMVISLILCYPLVHHSKHSFRQKLLSALKNKWFIFFILAGLLASLPVMLVSRQQEHYLLQAYPLFTIAFTQLLSPVTTYIVTTISQKHLRYVTLLITSSILCVIAIIVVIANFGKLGAYKDLLHDTIVIGRVVPKSSIVYLAPSLTTDVKIHSVMYRYNQISFSNQSCYQYQLWPKVAPARKIPGYHKFALPLRKFILYQKNVLTNK